MGVFPGGFVRGKASGLKMVRQYAANAAFFLLPLWEKVARTKSVTDEGLRSIDRPEPLTRLASDDASHPLPQGPTRGEGKSYTDAVVTPPSTTMVWPVMKLDASEAR